jgi:hypothetical protein
MRIAVKDVNGNLLGHVWDDGPATIRSEPPGIIAILQRVIEASPADADAAEVVRGLDGHSNGYLVCSAVS